MPVVPSKGGNTFRKFPRGEGGRLHDFGLKRFDCKISGAEGAVLDNVCDVSKKWSLKMQ